MGSQRCRGGDEWVQAAGSMEVVGLELADSEVVVCGDFGCGGLGVATLDTVGWCLVGVVQRQVGFW